MEVKWSKQASRQLTDALDFIVKEGFVSYAFELEDKIISKIDNLENHYDSYHLDRFKLNNDGTYRAVEIDKYRISYRVKDQIVKIIRIRHTSRKPRKY